ncbi:MAG: type II secretion system protein GspK [Bryobacteraceae bacterium]
MRIVKRTSRERGGALLTVLWLSAGLAAIGFSVSSAVRSETDRVSTSADGLRASYLASGAVERAIQWMSWGPNFLRADGTSLYWNIRQTRMTMSFPSGMATVELLPENSKLNINVANADDLYRVVLAVSGDEAQAHLIAEGIVDWRSPSSGLSNYDQYYFSIRPTFQARHASFQEIEELLLVRGMTPELFYGNYVADPEGRLYARGGLRDCLSVWGSVGPFDANTASPALLTAMGVTPDAVDAIVKRRQSQPFASAAELSALAPGVPRVSILPGNTMWTLRAAARLRRPDGGASEVVRIAAATVKVQSDMLRGRGIARVVPQQQNQNPVQVIRWYDDAWSQDVPMTGSPATAVPGAPGPTAGGNGTALSSLGDDTKSPNANATGEAKGKVQ